MCQSLAKDCIIFWHKAMIKSLKSWFVHRINWSDRENHSVRNRRISFVSNKGYTHRMEGIIMQNHHFGFIYKNKSGRALAKNMQNITVPILPVVFTFTTAVKIISMQHALCMHYVGKSSLDLWYNIIWIETIKLFNGGRRFELCIPNDSVPFSSYQF